MNKTLQPPKLFPANGLIDGDLCIGWCAHNQATEPTQWDQTRLGSGELEFGLSLSLPRRNRWLAGRCAAKTALQRLLNKTGLSFDLREINIMSDSLGCPIPWAYLQQTYRISIAHKERWSLAMVSTSTVPGIDLEHVVTQTSLIERRALTEAEQDWLQHQNPRDEWLTRLWVAKEAVGKSTGKGLGSSPRSLSLEDQIGERLRVAGRWVETRRNELWVAGWTLPPTGR
jgi:phosphopantetheinyl transferase